MKKIVTISVLALAMTSGVASANAIRAGAAVEFNNDSQTLGALKGGYEFDTEVGKFGFDVEGKTRLGGKEYSEAQQNKSLHEGTIGIDYTYAFGNAYVQPRVEYTQNNINQTNTSKAGLKAGYNFDNGVFTAARYRYDSTKNDNAITNANFGDINTNRADITLGWKGDMFGASVNYVYQDIKSDKVAPGNVSDRKRNNSLEYKVFLTNLNNYEPYIQYSDKNLDSTNYDGTKAKADHQVKLGVNMKF
ncbi:hypothetical protein DBZ36_09105 [Alginatibacterium sediminis]|uniref:Porin n=1 Tax=Alginatibacterium sediminis TaxID=2164068 RepID=A0A420ECX7_9ALTE|nr:oligogalacturonate-specific porin KdgM family protein [Alginatibacterium sediminis]RKF18557.1 hypothetical protein DBZ36_09105 [Alginatibacterium sediminis]